MTFKILVSGHLEFGSGRSYERMLNSFSKSLEIYYKNDVLLKAEEIFNAETFTMEIPRINVVAADKTWRNTVSLLEMIVQFATAGSVNAWKLDNGTVLQQVFLEPHGDKTAVQSFLRGRELITEGKKDEARQALSQAIDKFERHALAYERRGYVNFMLDNLEDAVYDFSKSININPHNPEAYAGRALVRMNQRNFAAALVDLAEALKSSIPHQPIHWKARRLKGECHLEREEFALAEQELRFFTRRAYKKEDSNYGWRRKAFFNFGKTLLALGKFKEAVDAFNQAIEIEIGKDNISAAERFLFRGIALQKAGEEGFKQDLTVAAQAGSERAARLLAGSL